MKRILSLLLCMMMLGSTCIGTFAADNSSPVMETIRVFNPGADITVNLTGTAGEHASVMVFEPGITLPDMTTDYAVFNDGVGHIDSVKLDESGKHSFKYLAEEAGIYTVYVLGADIDYSATGNDSPTVNPDRIYVESWTQGLTYSHPDLNYMVMLSPAQLKTYGVKAVAQNIWSQLELQPEGRRTIFIQRNFSPYTNTPNSDGKRIWWDEGVKVTYEMLDAFFKEFSSIGGKVDFLYADMEHSYSMYAITPLASADRYAAIAKIYNHERWPEFKAALTARGYDHSEDGDIPLSSVWKYGSPAKNYLKFNAVCSQMAADYFTAAIYAPAKKYFANIKYAEYGFSDRKTWLGGYEMTAHPNYIGGNLQVAGTHSAVPLYSKRTQGFAYQQFLSEVGAEEDKKVTVYAGAGKDFAELQGTIEMLRISANATKDNTITPWIATQPVGKESYSDDRYRNEMFMHIALHNPDRLLHYNPSSYVKEEGDDNIEVVVTQEEQSEMLMTVLDEVNGLIATEDRRSLNVDHADFNVPFAISGIYTGGKNIWRITPDTAVVTPEAFKTAEEDSVTFAASGVTISFPGGRIVEVENTTSDIGYWVETANGVMPEITYPDSLKTETEGAVINFYDVKYGQKTDIETATTVDAVATFKGFYGSNLNFIAAKYDENGMLIDIETKECGIFNPNGVAAFNEISKDLDTAEIKFFLWEDNTIRPLANGEM